MKVPKGIDCPGKLLIIDNFACQVLNYKLENKFYNTLNKHQEWEQTACFIPVKRRGRKI